MRREIRGEIWRDIERHEGILRVSWGFLGSRPWPRMNIMGTLGWGGNSLVLSPSGNLFFRVSERGPVEKC